MFGLVLISVFFWFVGVCSVLGLEQRALSSCNASRRCSYRARGSHLAATRCTSLSIFMLWLINVP